MPGRERLDEPGDRVAHRILGLARAHRLPVVDEQRDPHRVRADPRRHHPARDPVLRHLELLGREVGDRLSLLVDDLHVGHALLLGRRDAGQRDARDGRGHDHPRSQAAESIRHESYPFLEGVRAAGGPGR